MKEQTGIFCAYEFFYLEGMLACVTSALTSAEAISRAYGESESELNQEQFLDCFQNIIQQAAAVSRYFWPTASPKNKHMELHRRRGNQLRAAFEISEDNPLKNRDLRNRIEHFDEKLDIFLSQPIAGEFIPAYVGSAPKPGIQSHFFRAFFTDIGVFEVLGERYAMQPLYDEMIRLHDLLVACARNGYRLPRVIDA
jgi:hypothetical protein